METTIKFKKTSKNRTILNVINIRYSKSDNIVTVSYMLGNYHKYLDILKSELISIDLK